MRYNAGMCSSWIHRGVGRINRSWANASAQLRQLRANLVARLIVASAAIVLLSLLAANAAALLILRDEFDRHTESSLQQGQRAALLVLTERANALDALVMVLSQRPTLQRLLAEQEIAALTRFLEDFRAQSEIDWIAICRQAAPLLATADAPHAAALCDPATATGYQLVGSKPILTARTPVGEQSQLEIVAGQVLDRDFLQALTAASALEHSVVDPGAAQRLVSTWTTAVSIPDGALETGEPAQTLRRTIDAADGAFAVTFTATRQAAPSQLWLESVLPISARLAAERRVAALLALSMAISAVVLIGVAVLGVRRANRSVTAALRRSEAAVASAQGERMAALESLDALIQSIVEGVIMADDAGVVRFVSVGAARILETAPDAGMGAALNTLIPPADGSVFPLAELLAQPGHNRMLEVRTQSGKAVTVAVSATRIHPLNASGRLNAFILRDVTEEEAHNRLRSYFLSSISHEFRTPLSTLKASLELLVSEENPLDPAESRQLLRPAYRSVVGLQTLIDNLLTSSTIEAGQFALHLGDVDLNAVLADAIRVVTPLLERRQQALILDLPALPPPVKGDVTQLTQVLINLLSNASKYSPAGAPIEVAITPRAGEAGNVVRVAVADHGPGIDPARRAEIFRRFVRHHDNAREQYGVGLGLYVAKTTITAHGGSIDVDERPGGGSIFWFELPLI
jgi:PAS domain S-box-containing protein